MVKKMVKYSKFILCIALILSLVAPSYAALSASDGSAFVTKAEFDSALADFNARLTTFEAGINSKIDSQVTSYLDRNGIWNGKDVVFLVNEIRDFNNVTVTGRRCEILKGLNKWVWSNEVLCTDIPKSGLLMLKIQRPFVASTGSSNGWAALFMNDTGVDVLGNNKVFNANAMSYLQFFDSADKDAYDTASEYITVNTFVNMTGTYDRSSSTSEGYRKWRLNMASQLNLTTYFFVQNGHSLAAASRCLISTTIGPETYTSATIDVTNSGKFVFAGSIY